MGEFDLEVSVQFGFEVIEVVEGAGQLDLDPLSLEHLAHQVSFQVFLHLQARFLLK